MKEQTKKRKATGWVRAGAIALVGLAVIAGVLLWARSNSGATGTPSSATTTQSGTMMQTNEGGQITIKVTWRRNAGPVFSVEMDTHVVNLDGYDLRQLAVLRTGQGQEIQPASWNAASGGHHRNGTLTLPIFHNQTEEGRLAVLRKKSTSCLPGHLRWNAERWERIRRDGPQCGIGFAGIATCSQGKAKLHLLTVARAKPTASIYKSRLNRSKLISHLARGSDEVFQ